MRRFLRDDRREGVALDRAPLFRLALFRTGACEYALVWTVHHILVDGRSISTILRDVFERYDASLDGTVVKERPAAPTFASYARWAANEDTAASESFWRERLRGFRATTPLPVAGEPDPTRVADDGCFDRFARLDEATTASLVRLARASGTTLTTCVHAAWALVLSHHSGESDVVFGATRAGRKAWSDAADEAVGLFITTLPLRVAIDADARLETLLQHVRSHWNDLRPVERTPLTSVRRWSELPTAQPLFESLVVFERWFLGTALRELGGRWRHRGFRIYEKTAYPLALSAFGDPELTFCLQYDGRRFDAATVDRILERLTTVLAGFVSGGLEQRVGEIRSMGAGELATLATWSGCGLALDAGASAPERTLDDLAEAQRARTPANVALTWRGGDGSAGELTLDGVHARAERLARALRRHGVGPGVGVAICGRRSPELVVAVLGVVKAGGFYVPLDADYPQERLRFMLEDSGVTVVVADAAAARTLPSAGLATILFDDLAEETDDGAAAGRGTPHVRAAASDPAYMMYTSGSTGTPKGVAISHRSIVNQLLWLRDRYAIDRESVLSQNTPFGFDTCVSEMWLALIVGARLAILDPGGHRDAASFVDAIVADGITMIDVVPSVLRALVGEPGFRNCSSLRTVVVGGERVAPDLVASFYACGLRAELHNHYGPTETAIQVTHYPCPRTEPQPLSIPIGRPVANTQIYVLDDRGNPVPIGVPGELYIGGVQVGLGYWRRPELTAERFVPDRFGPDPGARLYRTGDLARYRSDGEIEYLRRVDDQVKVRGFRVELGEIESAAASHPGVDAVAVAVRSSARDEAELVAYYTCRAPIVPDDLRLYLKAKLPEHMVPSAYVRLSALPLLTNGKLDRSALPQPDDAARSYGARAAYVAPRDDVERFVSEIVADVLGIANDRLGIDDDFFEAGGHSLLAMRVASRVAATFRTRIAVSEFFKEPTVRALSNVAVASRPAGQVAAIALALARIAAMSPEERDRRQNASEPR
ncbi:MAG: hypothetical protein NVSMB21_07430 [Vulcanimicrobiaceae bacterium]